MKQFKIRIIEKPSPRRDDIIKNIAKFNLFNNDDCCWSQIWYGDELRDESTIQPNIFLLHLSDQVAKDDMTPCCDYINKINKDFSTGLMILYSAGNISKITDNSSILSVKLGDDEIWTFNLTNNGNICIIERPILNSSDLKIESALEAYAANEDKNEFFKILKGAFPEHLLALIILCQGYLAAHSDGDKGIKELLKMPNDDWLSFAYKNKMKTESYDHWWAIIKSNEVRKDIPKSKVKDIKDLESLLIAIENGKEISDPALVANAYRAITRTIG